MKALAVVIARTGSTRLPGKVLMDLAGKPVLSWVVAAARAAPFVREVIVATSTLPGDDRIADWCRDTDTQVFRGSETDVLSRVAGAARAALTPPKVVVRLTGDCPFLDPFVIGAVVRLQLATGCAYASNVDPRTWPDGLDVEAFTTEALFAAEREATRPIDRECVTTWIARNRSRFPAETLICPLPGLDKERWVLDTEHDLRFCREVATWLRCYPAYYLDILSLLDHSPGLRDINKHHPPNERYYEALANEPIYPRSYSRSQAQLARAKNVIPLGAQTFSKSHVQYPQPSPLFVTHGQGGVVWDRDGNEYVDLVSALLPNVLGYRDRDVDEAIRRQLNSGISFSLATDLEAELAETLCRLIPCAEMVRFAKNGSDVTTAAIRLARAYTGRDQVLICGGYHGWHDWSIERDLGVPKRVQQMTTRIPFGMHPNMTGSPSVLYAAVIVEPESSPDYLRELREFCDKTGALLIFDEVITGFRFNLGGAQKLYGVTPDLACFGKAMANGMPLSALVGWGGIMQKLAPPNPCVFFSGTFGGETLSLAASIATIAKMERENVIERLWQTGAQLALDAEQAINKYGLGAAITLSGQPPLTRLTFHEVGRVSADQIRTLFMQEMARAGVLIIASHNVCAAHTLGEMARVRRAYDRALRAIDSAIKSGYFDRAAAIAAPTVRQ